MRKTWRRGTHRALSPADTYDRARAHFRAAGITRVADVTGLDTLGVPVAMAYRPNARNLAVSPGKGTDRDAAFASAAMESLECWHAERPLVPLLRASHRELSPRHRVIDVARLPRVAVRPWSPDRALLWTEANELLSGASVWVPFEVVHLDFSLPLPASSGALMPGSNGLASGNDPAEALTHALCELIERDASALWHCLDDSARDRTRVDLAAVPDDACQELLQRLDAAGAAVAAWDLTSDVGVPAFRCELVERSPAAGQPFLPGVGAGCHLSAAVALARAITEAAQTRLTLVSGARDDLRADDYAAARDPAALARMQSRMSAPGPLRAFRDVVDRAGDTLEEDLLTVLTSLARTGVREVAVVDLTRPDVGIPVVRAIVPGLEGIHDLPGYVPGPRMVRALEARGLTLGGAP